MLEYSKATNTHPNLPRSSQLYCQTKFLPFEIKIMIKEKKSQREA